ncbi:hypothetical protein A3K24_02835 [candidate division Kazan bacterium RIFCSPHIGHO2_01_FULL_44_14]|uniref:Uncharacterized protein n=1 Tax=candidate division Kazan bacterium RIFCSPLOWO2_01_FULL_45_19 TaxID=1798538 RepID=A0A1F4NQK5_UNCK3|nr:hypothetical protein [uncultured bacterium]OGB73744.1 MAG: hypothetical protein A3K51_02835 [candidate division Kazan bacterium RIFCSPLOWO2_01_FULL_45_19]OGB77989.1 MAG: hypothetical protein A3K24_02835 [candidate division Kazan bacterium RIFCSPHIGHO2_01_FULL_44_14]
MNFAQVEMQTKLAKTPEELLALLTEVTAPISWLGFKQSGEASKVLKLIENRNRQVAEARTQAIEIARQEVQNKIGHIRKFPNAYS